MASMIANLDDAKVRAKIQNRIGQLRGKYRLEVVKYRPRRSDRQNRYYWPCFVQPFANYLRDQGEPVTDLEAHDMLKQRYLKKTRIDKRTGEAMDYVRSTTDLDTGEFNIYLDHCAEFLASMFDIVVPDPADYHER